MEFVEVMRQWRRMCDAYTTDDAVSCCKGCPMSGRGCGSIYENGNAEPDIIEREVMKWAAEHPEPVYPSWAEWLVDSGVFPQKMSTVTSIAFNTIRDSLSVEIPADIAQKLGIKPKEG